MEPEVSLMRSKEPFIGSHQEPDISSPNQPSLLS
jgi:hypothetical protein